MADRGDKICVNFFFNSYLTMMPRMRQALIEFENIEDAMNCVSTTQTSQVYIMDRPVFFNFSTSQEITRYTSVHIKHAVIMCFLASTCICMNVALCT